MSLKNWLKKVKATLRAWTASTTKPPSAPSLPLPQPQTDGAGSSSNNTDDASTQSAPHRLLLTHQDAIDISSGRTISKYVKNIHAMPVAGELRNIKLSTDRVSFETSDEAWISKEWGRIALVFWNEGQLILGEFDARKPGQKMKGLENIHGGYIQSKQPKQGDSVWFVVYDMTGTKRSNVAAGGLWK
jgi:hypothetical protein